MVRKPDNGSVAASAKARRSVARSKAPPKRDSAATRERILQVALTEFAAHGYSGGRIDRIARAARINVRMIYHYFGNKDALYLAALERSYRGIREQEQMLDLSDVDPITGMRRLIELTFDFLATSPHFVRLIMGENLMKGKMVRKSKVIPQMTQPLVKSLESILKRGQEQNDFPLSIDAENLYISILGLCFIHISNRHTLGSMFQRNFADPDWLAKRKTIVSNLLITYLTRSDVGASQHWALGPVP
jgi:AcrR family transcriptional regulator